MPAMSLAGELHFNFCECRSEYKNVKTQKHANLTVLRLGGVETATWKARAANGFDFFSSQSLNCFAAILQYLHPIVHLKFHYIQFMCANRV